MKDRSNIEQPVAVEFKRFNDEFAASLRSETTRLQSAIDQILKASGKHVRPLLVLLAAKACGGVTENTINSAVFLELLHTATLIHDDVIDETKQRRGVPSLNAIFDNRVSVLVGDYVLSSALIRSIQTGNLKIIGIVSGLGRDLSEGEIKQLETAEESIIDEACYMQVIRKKTAMLLSACAEIGAISANASDEMVKKCRDFGEYLGYSFQIKDDIFDYFKEANIGKPTGNDIREGKVTLPLLYALRTAKQTEEVERYLRIIKEKDFSTENIEELIAFAKANGGIEYAEKRMFEFRDKAVEVLLTLPESDARDSLLQLADYIIERKK
ncbi:MAG: polyprenyl synthetase family protein [Parabacteroides sp.]|nr:polyprenyl synthetase family protein [Parabacteroides sp.]